MNAETLPAGRDNPYNSAFVVKENTFATEREAKRQLNVDESVGHNCSLKGYTRAFS